MRISIVFLFLIISCSGKESSEKIQAECDLSPDTLSNSKIVRASINNRLLTGVEMEVSGPYSVNDRGCVVVPDGASDDLVITSGNHVGRAEVDSLQLGFNKPVALQETIAGHEIVFSYCGETLEPGEMFLKFKPPFPDNTEYFTKTGESVKVPSPNPQGCSKVPLTPGRITLDGKLYANIFKPVQVAKVVKEEAIDFLSACKHKPSDPIVSALSKEFNTSDCNLILKKVSEARFQNKMFLGFQSQGIQSLSALKGLPFKRLDLSGNKILFLDDIPENTQYLDLNNNPVATLATLPLQNNLKEIRLYQTRLENLRGINRLKELNKIDLNNTLYLNSCDDLNLSHFSHLSMLRAEKNRCISNLVKSNTEIIPGLVLLHLGTTGLTSLDWIHRFPNLKTLYINQNNIRDISPLKRIENLDHIFVVGNPIEICPTDSPVEALNSLCRKLGF